MSIPAPRARGVALVTGASAGIGAAIATELAARGHNLAIVARRKPKLDALKKKLTDEHGVQVHTLVCDLSKPAPRGRLAGRIEKLELEVDVLINNAGFATGGAFHESDPERELEQVRVLVEAPVALTSAFAPGMASRRKGAILNVASTAGMQPLPYSAGYAAAKAYVLAFSEALHQELRVVGVTVTALAPGPVTTDFWEIAGWEVSGGDSFESAVPGPAWVSPEQVARDGLKGLENGDRVVVPGRSMRAAMSASRYIPHALKLPIIERVRRPKAPRK